MKHNIRINGVVKEVDCELGSGRFDKNGREIIEGDKVKTPDNEILTVRAENGVIGVACYSTEKNPHVSLTSGGQGRRRNPFLLPLHIFGDKLEVVGHVEDKQ